jgi:hypothetical protein
VILAGDRVELRECGAGEKARFFGVFDTLRGRAHVGNGGTIGGAGTVISRAAMGESGRAQKPSKRRTWRRCCRKTSSP